MRTFGTKFNHNLTYRSPARFQEMTADLTWNTWATIRQPYMNALLVLFTIKLPNKVCAFNNDIESVVVRKECPDMEAVTSMLLSVLDPSLMFFLRVLLSALSHCCYFKSMHTT